MELPAPLDAVIIGPATILGLLGAWHGLARSAVAWPMRWLLPLLGTYAAGKLAELGLVVVWELAELSRWMGPPVPWVAFIVACAASFVPLLMFMDNLIDRVAVWTAGRRIALGERLLGGLLGVVCGLALAAIAIEHASMRRATAEEAAWVRTSVLLPYFRDASAAVESALSSAWSTATGMRRRQR
jgi:uncharacterized membrane protein required for colicin V production